MLKTKTNADPGIAEVEDDGKRQNWRMNTSSAYKAENKFLILSETNITAPFFAPLC